MPSIIKYLYLCSALVLAFINHCVQAEMDFTYSAADLFHLIRTEHRLTRALNDIGKEVGNFGEMLEMYVSFLSNWQLKLIDSHASNNHYPIKIVSYTLQISEHKVC